MTFLIKLMFRRVDKFEGRGGASIQVGLIFGMLIGLHVWGRAFGGGGLI